MTIIKHLNSSFLKIESDDAGIIRHISDYFTFTVPNAKFSPAFKEGRWDGKIRLFKNKKYLTSGLQNKLIKFLSSNKYTFSQDYSQALLPEEIIKKCISSFNLPFELKDYQHKSIIHALQGVNGGLLVSPTSSGKSFIVFVMLMVLIKIFKKDIKKIIIAVPTIDLVIQLSKDFISYCTTEKQLEYFNNNIHLLFGGTEKDTDKPIIIGTFASFGLLPKEYFHDVDVVIGDECHLLSKTYGTHIFENCINSRFRLGCTGTLQETVLDKLVLEGLFGPPFQFISTSEMIEQKYATPVEVYYMLLKYPTEMCNLISKLSYAEEYDYLMTYQPRLENIVNFICTLKKNTLVLFTKISKHGDLLFEMLQKRLKDKQLIYIHGSSDSELREAASALAENNNNVIILASYGIFSTGRNIKNLSNIVFASPYKSKIKVLQSIGRGLRLHYEKDVCRIYDFVDDCRERTKTGKVKRNNFLFAHFLKRHELYQQENFKTTVVNL